MNRRGFLAALAGAMVLDPERLLWKPGSKLISIPKPRGILVSISPYWFDFNHFERFNLLVKKIESLRAGRDLVEYAGRCTFPVYHQSGGLAVEEQAVIMPRGESFHGQFVDTSNFDRIEIRL